MKKPSQVTEQDMLLDLMGGESTMPITNMSSTINGSQNNADLLADILDGGQSMSMSSQAPTTSPPSTGNMNSIMDLFDAPSSKTTQQAPVQQVSQSQDLFGGMSSPAGQSAQGPPVHTAFDKNGLLVTLQVQRNATAVQVMARFRNTGNFERLTDLGLQAAVPKSQKLQLQGISIAELDGGEEATQQMRIISVQGVSRIEWLTGERHANTTLQAPPQKLRLRMKVSYAQAGSAVTIEQVDWSEPV
jgi:AP-1 complex subunit gamma-1